MHFQDCCALACRYPKTPRRIISTFGVDVFAPEDLPFPKNDLDCLGLRSSLLITQLKLFTSHMGIRQFSALPLMSVEHTLKP